MARARNIKPAFFTNELLGTEDPMISLTFAGLWCLADKMGVLEDRPLRIKAELFPYRDSLDVNGYLSVLARLGFIVRYENEGRRFIQVCNFRKHQSPHHTEKAKGFPFPSDPKSLIVEDNGYRTVIKPIENVETQVPERSDSLIPDTGFIDSGFTDIPQNGKQDVTEKTKKPAKEKANFTATDLMALGVDEQHAKDWIAVRTKKKAAMTLTALNGVIREAEKAKVSLAEAIRICAEKSWQGFEAGWLTNLATNGSQALAKHTGFADRDYHSGLFEKEDGSYGF